MRSLLGQVQERASVPRAADAGSPAIAALATKEIPYDYVATFTLTGLRGNRVQDVFNISIEGAFVAVAIGYSFIPPSTLAVEPAIDGVTGFEVFLPLLAKSLLVRFIGIEFKYSIVDSGVGRELQNKPIHNIAGLGEATGERPFRLLAKPMLFMPRSTIRIEVEEISEGPIIYSGAQLYIVLHGYKMLGYGTALP
jgi:hypothetical protein